MCSVVGCESGQRRAPQFRLPEDPERRMEWVQFLLEVNEQRIRESCWTDITICIEHFEEDCFVKGAPPDPVQMKPSAVPSLRMRIKTEPEELEPCQESVVTTEVASPWDRVTFCNSPSSCSEESGPTSDAAPEDPVPSDRSEDFMSDYVQVLQEVVNLDVIREKAALLNMRGKCVVNENRLLRLFSHKCPSCSSEVKVEKFTHGTLLIVNQQCLQCEYRNQWKSQADACVPEDLTGGIDVTPVIKQALLTDKGGSAVTGVAASDEESESSDVAADEDLTPTDDHLLETESDTEPNEDSEGSGHLCPDCGTFFSKRRSHMCDHIIKPYSCNICGKRCANEVYLNAHSKVHDENYEHPCKYCNITFKIKVDKINHQRTHLNERKPYKCHKCPETFAKNRERRIHQQKHRGSQVNKCHICGIEFDTPHVLQRHLAVHSGLRPYKCSVCERGFKQASCLLSHLCLHTGERPYDCQHRDECFNHNVSLKSHVQCCHTSNPMRDRKKDKNKTADDAVDAQENECKEGEELNSAEEDDRSEEMVQERNSRAKYQKRRRGRPKGRPKKNAAGNLALVDERQGRCSNMKTAEVKVRTLKRKHSDEETDDELIESNITFDSSEEEERSEKVTLHKKFKEKEKDLGGETGFDLEDENRTQSEDAVVKE